MSEPKQTIWREGNRIRRTDGTGYHDRVTDERTAWFQHRLTAVSEGICPVHNGRLIPVGRIGRCEDGGEGWSVHRTAKDDPMFRGEIVVTQYARGHSALGISVAPVALTIPTR